MCLLCHIGCWSDFWLTVLTHCRADPTHRPVNADGRLDAVRYEHMSRHLRRCHSGAKFEDISDDEDQRSYPSDLSRASSVERNPNKLPSCLPHCPG